MVTLSIHEALTFDGVELALHPDVFHKKEEVTKKKEQNKQQQKQQQTQVRGNNEQLNCRLRPGDLVEIRVWSARPGTMADDNRNDISSSNSTNSGRKGNTANANTATGSTYHSRNPSLVSLASSMLSPTGPAQSNSNKGATQTYHSRNPSLVTLSSIQSPGNGTHQSVNNAARGNGVYGSGTTSLANTPVSSVKPGESAVNVSSTIMPPLMPSIIGDNRHSPMARSSIGGFHDEDDEEKETLELHGEYLLDGCSQNETRGTPADKTTNISSTVSTSLVGSTLPLDSLVSNVPLLAQKNKISFSTIETDSMQGHSRDNSFVTSSSVMHVSLLQILVMKQIMTSFKVMQLLTPQPSSITESGKFPLVSSKLVGCSWCERNTITKRSITQGRIHGNSSFFDSFITVASSSGTLATA